MNMRLGHARRLTTRGEAGLVCDGEGVSLGGVDLVRVHLGARANYCVVRSHDQMVDILWAAYGPQPDDVTLRIHRRLQRAASWLEAGELGRAGIEVVGLGLPDLTPEAMTKLAKIADLEKAGQAWESEPRVAGGRTGGGQWTAGGVDVATTKPARTRPTPPRTRATPHRHPTSNAKPRSSIDSFESSRPQTEGLLVPVSTVALPVAGLGPAREIALPAGAEGAALAAASVLLNRWTEGRQSNDIKAAMVRFGLKPNRPANVMAAAAYVWCQYKLWIYDDNVPRNGPRLDAASQAVMRLVLVDPGVFVPILQGYRPSSLITKVANAGIADYVYDKARPPGVARRFQTTSASARAAVDTEVEKGRFIAHHLIAPNVWKDHIADVALAYDDGWNVDSPSNIIWLAKDESAQRELAPELPVHRGPHPTYDAQTRLLMLDRLKDYPEPRTSTEAHAVFEAVARANEASIRSGARHPWLKVGL